MDYAKLSDKELDELFQWRRREYDFSLYLNAFLEQRTNSEEVPERIRHIKDSLNLLTPNVVNWAFNHDDWRPAQSIATYVTCGRLGQYADLVGQQLRTRHFCYPYIYPLARIATPKAIGYIQQFLDSNMAVEKASSDYWRLRIAYYIEPISIALIALEWLEKFHSIKPTKSYNQSWYLFMQTWIKNNRFRDLNTTDLETELEQTRQQFADNMNFLAKNFG